MIKKWKIIDNLLNMKNMIIIIIITKVGNAMPEESGNPKTPAPQYQAIERKNRKEKQRKTNGSEQRKLI